MTEEQEEKEKFMIEFKVISELIGSPEEHVDKTMKLYLENLKKNNRYRFQKVTYFPPELQEKTGFYAAFAEIDVLARNIPDIIGFCFDYMPSSVEIIKPIEFKLKGSDITVFLNDLQDRLHKVEMHAKNMTAKTQLLKKQFLQVIRYTILHYLEQNKEGNEEDLSKATGIEKEMMTKYMEALVKRGEIEKKEDKYILTGKFKP